MSESISGAVVLSIIDWGLGFVKGVGYIIGNLVGIGTGLKVPGG